MHSYTLCTISPYIPDALNANIHHMLLIHYSYTLHRSYTILIHHPLYTHRLYRYCPMTIDMIDRRIMKNGRRRTLFFIPWANTTTTTTGATSATTAGATQSPVRSTPRQFTLNVKSTTTTTTPATTASTAPPPPPSDTTPTIPTPTTPTAPVLPTDPSTWTGLSFRVRSYQEVTKLFPMVPIPRLHKNKKLSSIERKRRHVIESYKAYLNKSSSIGGSSTGGKVCTPPTSTAPSPSNPPLPNTTNTTDTIQAALSTLSTDDNTLLDLSPTKPTPTTTTNITTTNTARVASPPPPSAPTATTATTTHTTTNTTTASTTQPSTTDLAPTPTPLDQVTLFDTTFLENTYAPILLRKKGISATSATTTTTDTNTYNTTNTNNTNTNTTDNKQRWEGTILMATSSRHWSEYIIRYTYNTITILNNTDSIRPLITIPRTSIYNIHQMYTIDTPLFYLNNIFSFFEIHTFARIYYFMTKTKYIYIVGCHLCIHYILLLLSPHCRRYLCQVRLGLGLG